MLTALRRGEARVQVSDVALEGDDLAGAVGAVAARLHGARRVAVVATPTLETVVAIAGAVEAGVTVVTINPQAGETERAYVLKDSAPDLVLDEVDLTARSALPPEVDGAGGPSGAGAEAPALVIYTSGTTGPPKGAVIPRRAIAANIDALADAWAWSPDDVLGHALPLFHVHGLVLGTLGPLRIGSALRHVARFAPVPGGTLYFAVPTMWSRVPAPEAFASARLLVSGSAALPVPVFDRFVAQAGQRVAERYGLTETLINTAARADGDRRPGVVGAPLRGVEVRVTGAEEFGPVEVRGPNVFTGYLGNPAATAVALAPDGWFATGDLGVFEPDGQLRIVGRQSTDLIKSGGYKIGAGEIENALLAHPAVAEAAVIGVPDDDLGQRIVAVVVTRDTVEAADLIDHVASTLAPHKRPREVRFATSLPRNPMGKVQKKLLLT
ncbi:acyl-CoA synthetase [Parafrankia colletiae]|uniref:Acyl-CoA synthetase n=1 Tax=Parafrankia colletiae TaxID=573497 RepID=A0A1S1QLM6_9ACTN|nr:AMP-binding protein [Parafrankia colletiae]MCK9900892.1 AMP-binding protein [Frankia sp. Cpl3]OHV34597.1 acyl-CoA synthetase [Parafrankia colletiae]